MQSTGQGGIHNLQPVQYWLITVCRCLEAPMMASNGQALMQSVQPMHSASTMRAIYFPVGIMLAFVSKLYLTRIPGLAPLSGCNRKMSLSPGPAANTIPSDMPKRIFRGARLATITVKRPSTSSGV